MSPVKKKNPPTIKKDEKKLDQLYVLVDQIASTEKSLQKVTSNQVVDAVEISDKPDSIDKARKVLQKSKDALEISEKRFRSIIENSGDIITLINADGIITYTSPSITKILGYQDYERPGHSVFENIHPDDLHNLKKLFKKLTQNPGLIISNTIRYRHKNGKWLWIEGNAKNLLDDPAIRSIVVNCRDITKRKIAEEKLEENERRLSTLMENLPGMAYRCLNDRDWTVEFLSLGCLELTGYPPEQFTSGQMCFNDVIHPDDRERVWNEVQIAVEKREHFQLEYRIKTNIGLEKWVWEQGCGIFDENGNLLVLEGFITDISERIYAREYERKFTRIIAQTDDAVLVTNSNATIEYVNPAFERITGYSSAEVRGRKASILKSGKHDKSFYQKLWNTIQKGKSYHDVFINRRKDGSIFYEQKTITPLLDDKGKITHFVSTAKDITDRVQAESALRDSEQQYRTLVETANTGYLIIDNEGRVLVANQEYIRLTGHETLDEILGRKVTEWTADYDQERNANEVKKCMEQGFVRNLVIDYVNKVGEITSIEINATVIQTQTGPQILSICRDITNRKQAEMALRTSEAQFSNAMTIAKAGHWEYDVASDTFTFNDHFYAIFHTNVDEIGGYTMSSEEYAKMFVHPDDIKMVGEEIKAAMESVDTDSSHEVEHRIIYADGGIGFIVVRIFTIKDEKGHTMKTYGVIQDITSRKQIELERSRFLNVLEASLNEIYIFNAKTLHFEYVNKGAIQNLGYSSEQMKTMTPLDLKPEYTEASFRKLIQPLFRHEKDVITFETNHRRADNSQYPVEVHLQLVELGDESVFLAVIMDITERKLANEILRESESKLLEAQQMAHLGNWYWDIKTGECKWSDEVYRIFRLDPEEFTPTIDSIMALSPWPDDNQRHTEIVSKAMDSKKQGSFEQRFLRPDGSTGYYYSTFKGVYDDNGVVIAMKGTIQDITRRKEAEQHLALLEFALNHAHEASYLMDEDSRFLEVNEEACRKLGYTHDELLNMKVIDIDPDATMDKWYHDWKEIQKKGSATLETIHKHKDGHTFPVEVNANYFEYDGKKYNMALVRDITERKQSELALRESEERYRIVTHATNDVVWDWNLQSDSLWMNDSFQSVYGYSSDEIKPDISAWTDLLHPDDKKEILNSVHKAIESGNQYWSGEYRLRRKDGSYAYCYDRGYVMRDANNKPIRMVGALTDITERNEAQNKILRLNRVYKMLSAVNSLIVHVENRQELFEKACRIAVEEGEFLLAWIGTIDTDSKKVIPMAFSGINNGYLDEINISLDPDSPGSRGPTAKAILENKPFICNDINADPCMQYWRERALARGYRSATAIPLSIDGEIVGSFNLYSHEVNFFNEEEIKLLSELVSDISYAMQHILQKEKLEFLSYYDSLTGLANRTLFNDHLKSVLDRAGKNKRKVALLVCDLKQFRNINNVYGREAGDTVLQETAKRLRQLTRDPVNIGRITSDYFAMILHDVRDSTGIAYMFENKLFPTLNKPFTYNNYKIQVNFCGGIAVYPSDGLDPETLYRNAEAALKKAKSTGEQYLFYQSEMTARIAETLHIDNQLRIALKENQFVLHYQPKIDSLSHKIIGLEALIRWNDPESGLVPPGKFIPILEETGLILDVGVWALDRAASDFRLWKSKLKTVPRIAVNVSAIQLRQRDFVTQVEKAIRRGGKPVPMDIEITESLIMADTELNITKLKAVRMAGLGVAIDDFGTGYSSLSYIAKLPVDSLKIDRSFITNMTTQPESMTIVSTIINLAHSLNLKVVAEGVETEEQSKFLTLLKCDEMQGFLFSKPLPPEEIFELLRSDKKL